jgi:hypothetical protein
MLARLDLLQRTRSPMFRQRVDLHGRLAQITILRTVQSTWESNFDPQTPLRIEDSRYSP